jgi:hypothetical protein
VDTSVSLDAFVNRQHSRPCYESNRVPRPFRPLSSHCTHWNMNSDYWPLCTTFGKMICL